MPEKRKEKDTGKVPQLAHGRVDAMTGMRCLTGRISANVAALGSSLCEEEAESLDQAHDARRLRQNGRI